jgi:hypothetical protein
MFYKPARKKLSLSSFPETGHAPDLCSATLPLHSYSEVYGAGEDPVPWAFLRMTNLKTCSGKAITNCNTL